MVQSDQEELRISRKSYLWALTFLKPYGKSIFYLFLCGILAVTGETLTPKVVQIIIDDVVPGKDMELFLVLLGALIAINLLMLAAKNKRNLLQLSIGEQASRDMQSAIFRQLRRLGFAHYERYPAGETLAMFNTEVASVIKLYRNYLPAIIDNLLFVCVSVALMIGISGWLTLIMLPTFALYYLFGPYFERKAAFYGKKSGEGRVKFNQRIYESVSGFREFRSFGTQSWYHDETKSVHKQWAGVYRKAATFGFARGSFRRFIFYLGAIALMLLGVYLVRHEWITLGGFVAFSLLYMSAMFRLTLLVTQFTEQRLIIHQTLPLYQFMHKPAVVEDPADPSALGKVAGKITFDRVGFGYAERPDVIRDFTLDIQPGEKVAFVGTSGNGKTTLMKLIGRFYDPTEGEVRLDGIPIQKLRLSDLRESIGYVFQETYLFGSSVKDNIRFGQPEATDEQIEEAAKAAYAHDFIMALPDGYDTLVGERGIKLSGGQRQRIAVARAIIGNPDILVLDEATSALDLETERRLLGLLDERRDGKTTIVIAHRLSTVENADLILVVDSGKVADSGSHDELLASANGVYRELLNAERKNHDVIA